MTEKPDNYVLQVGDEIVVSHCFGKRKDIVTRTTKTMAICEKKGQEPIRYPRVYGFGFYPKGTSNTYTVGYYVYDKEEGNDPIQR